MRTFCRRSNLIRWVGTDDCPKVLQDAWKEFSSKRKLRDLESGGTVKSQSQLYKAYNLPAPQLDPPDNLCPDVCFGRRRENLTAHMELTFLANFTPPRIPGCKLYFTPQSIEVFHSFSRGSLRYTDYLQSEKHSLIYFKLNPTTQDLYPAQIRHIFRHTHLHGPMTVVDIFAVIHCYIPVVLSRDPFAPFPDFRAAIFAAEPSSAFQIVKTSQIHCHANHRPWDASSVVMRAVDRVRF